MSKIKGSLGVIEKILARNPDILIDPKTHERLVFEKASTTLQSESKQSFYPQIDGIFDLLHGASDYVSKAYDKHSPKYDPWILSAKPFLKFLKKITWATASEFDYANKVVDCISDDFNGVLLDIPVGTGIFTVEKYSNLKNASIFAIDVSLEMLKLAKRRYEKAGIRNIVYFRGDVSNLPFDDNSVDLLVSMSGIETFRNKDAAFFEMKRVVKTNGRFIGCTYITKKSKVKDFYAKVSTKTTRLLVGPFYTEEELREKLGPEFEISNHSLTKTIWQFDCIKQ